MVSEVNLWAIGKFGKAWVQNCFANSAMTPIHVPNACNQISSAVNPVSIPVTTGIKISFNILICKILGTRIYYLIFLMFTGRHWPLRAQAPLFPSLVF